MGTFDGKIGGDDFFENPFSLELARAGGRINTNRINKFDAQEWICSLPNGMFGKYRLNANNNLIDSSAPTDIVVDAINAAIDPTIRLGQCSFCHHTNVAIEFDDQVASFVRNNPGFDADEKRLAEVFFNKTRISAIAGEINRRHNQAMEELGVTATEDPLNEKIYKPFRSEMGIEQVASYTFLPVEEFRNRLLGASISSQVFGNLLNEGGTVSLSVLSANYETLVEELNLFEDIEI